MTKDEAREILIERSRCYKEENMGHPLYIQAIDCAIQALGDGWVSVEDGLPECEVLATDGLNYLVGDLVGYEGGLVRSETTHELLNNVTHYKRLSPPKPKQP